MNDEEKKGLEIIEEDAFDSEISEEELQQFYEENQDAIDLIGGLDMFESLMGLDDDSFEQLRPQFLQIFAETLREPESISEFRTLAITQGYTKETAKADFDLAINTINQIDFLSEPKKDFLKEIYTMVSNQLEEIVGSMNRVVRIPCELAEGTNIPTYAHDTDAGMDIYSPDEYTIAPGETIIIPTGIKAAIPEGYAILIQPRSGQSAKTKLRIANTPGLIDSGYRDEIGVIVENIEPPFKDIDYEFDSTGNIHIKSILHGESYTIAPGQRFAQMRLVQVPKAEFVQVESVGEIGEDRKGGFGSTDIVEQN